MPTLNVANATNLANGIPQIWDRAVFYDADRMSFLGKITGADGSDSPVLEKEDLTKVPGQTINFTVFQRLLVNPTTGTSTLQGNEEKAKVSTYAVTVVHERHATSFDKFAMKVLITDAAKLAGRQLADWYSRVTDDEYIKQIVVTDAGTPNKLYAGSATSVPTLGPGMVLNIPAFQRLYTAARRRGVQAWQTSNRTRMPFPVFGAVMSEIDYYSLITDTDFRQDMRLAAARGNDNPILSGEVSMLNGVILYPWATVNPGDGFLGSFLRAEANLAAALSSSATSVTAGPATAVTGVDYFKYFDDTTGAGVNSDGTNTIQIDNEEMTYTPTTGTVPGNSSVTVTRGTGGTTAASHSANALMTQRNLGRVLLFGKWMGCRAWAQHMQRTGQVYDYGKEVGIGLDWIYGLKGVQAADGSLANAMVLNVWSPNPSTI